MLQLWLAAICPMSAPYLERRSAFSIRKKDQLSFSLFHSLSPNFSAWRACNKRIAVKSQYGSSFSRGSWGARPFRKRAHLSRPACFGQRVVLLRRLRSNVQHYAEESRPRRQTPPTDLEGSS